MSTYTIYGRECNFPAVPVSTLDAYAPNQQTMLVAYRGKTSEDNAFITMWLHMLQRVDALERLMFISLDGGRVAALFDAKSDSSAWADLERYMGILCGSNKYISRPFYDALQRDKRKAYVTTLELEGAVYDALRATGCRTLPAGFTEDLHQCQQALKKHLNDDKA